MSTIVDKNNKLPVFTIALVSCLGLAYEVLLMRLFSIIQWHHFAYMIISIVLLGYGVSGAFLTLFQRWSKQYFQAFFHGNIILFGISAIVCFLLGQHMPFNPLELFWDSSQWLWLFALYLLLVVPFFCVANCVALAFSFYPQQISRIYNADLFGAGLGSIGIVLLLHWLFPEQSLKIIASLAMLAAVFAVYEMNMRRTWLGVLLLLAVPPWVLPERWIQLAPSQYKQLSQTMNIMGTRILEQKSSPLGLLTVVENKEIPFRQAPGLSLTSKQVPAEQLAVFTDDDAMTVINRFDGNLKTFQYLNETTSALPYQLLHQPEVLILGAGGGTEIIQAQLNQAAHIDAVEMNQQMVGLVKTDFANFAGNLYQQKNINVHVAEARGYLRSTNQLFDLVQISLMDSFAAASAGLTALNEDYLYTVEAFESYLRHLKKQGMLSLTRWVKIPPRDTLKLFATAVLALQRLGVSDPAQHLALIRSWNTATLLVKSTPFSKADIQRIKQFSATQNFDLAYYPGIQQAETNQYNILASAYFYNGAMALLSKQRDAFLDEYKYNLKPSTDDSPYFFHFLKLKFLPEIIQLPANQGLPLIEWGTVILYITLLQACLASGLLILVPLWWYQRFNSDSRPLAHRGFVLSYFFLIGLAFMFVEIAFVQKFILFLSHPIYAFSVVICGFLLFAGLGSGYSKKLSPLSATYFAFTGIVVCALIYLAVLPTIFSWLISSTDIIRIFASLILIAPLAFFMGMPFPLALAWIARVTPQSIPWAWGVNGCASVISAIMATILAVQFGFVVVILFALVLYSVASWLLVRQLKTGIASV